MLASCSGGSPSPKAAPASQASSTRPVATKPAEDGLDFPTPTALIDRFNELNAEIPPRLPEIVKLYHAENPLQQKWLRWLANSAAFYPLDKAMYEAFGEGWVPVKQRPTPAQLTNLTEERAEAAFTNSSGQPSSLQMVRLGPTWMISGFTLEYGVKTPDPDALVEKLIKSNADASWVPDFVRRLRAGEFKSAQEAREARRAERLPPPLSRPPG